MGLKQIKKSKNHDKVQIIFKSIKQQDMDIHLWIHDTSTLSKDHLVC